MANTGFLLPTSYGSPNNAWSLPQNALVEDTNPAFCTDTTAIEDYYDFSNILTAIPDGATIDGIHVLVRGRSRDSGATGQAAIKLSKNSGSSYTGEELTVPIYATGQIISTTYAGDAANLWGTTWTKESFGAEFRLAIRANSPVAGLNIEYIKIDVYYTSITTPTVTTQAATDKTDTTATLNGNVTDEGGEAITTRGFYLVAGTSGDPTSGDTVISEASIVTGAYSLPATGLLPNTNYRVAAFATNGGGASVGATVDVKTGFIARVPQGIIPAGGTLISSHPGSKYGHNDAETQYLQPAVYDLMTVANVFTTNPWYDTDDVTPINCSYDTISYNYELAGHWFADILSKAPIKFNWLVYKTAVTDLEELASVLKFTKSNEPLLDVNGEVETDVNGNVIYVLKDGLT